VTTCVCTHLLERHDMARARWQPCSRPGCGCVLFRPRPATSFTQMELYPLELAACPHCDSPYGTVHGPGCPYDPEIATRGETA